MLQLALRRMIVAGSLCAAVGGLMLGSVASACDTPVYRYAMYRWPPAPYVVCYFHSEPIGEEQHRVYEAIQKAAAQADKQPTANLAFVAVNLSQDKELTSVPPWVRDVWRARQDQTSPTYLVFAPNARLAYAGDLSVGDLEALVASPARTQLCQQLESGAAAVFVLLAGADEQANQKAEQQLKDLVKAVHSGEIELYASPDSYVPQGAEPESPKKPEHHVSYLKVSRTDPKEQWLLRSLMVVEDDLKDFDEPMVFTAYGRARLLEPYIGKGVTRDNMAESVVFVTGACSCMVKEQNPGVDLLVRYDWETAAAEGGRTVRCGAGQRGLRRFLHA